jgi:chorismate--pyruvate lyase
MSRFVWRTRLLGRGISPVLRSWLIEPGSLTARCQALCSRFNVQLLNYGLSRPLLGEPGGRQGGKVREVLLCCDGIPVIFAHTTLCIAPNRKYPEVEVSARGTLSRWLGGLGVRSLGSLLFAHPGFVRSEIEYLRLDSRHPLFQRVAQVALPETTLWARRSRHQLGKQAVLVTEIFLPAIERLGN